MKFKNALAVFAEFFEITCILSAVIVISYIFFGQLLEVSGESMFPTFKDKEQMVAEKLSLHYKEPQRGEVVIFQHPTQPEALIIKRIVGLPGERVLIKDGKVFINGNLLNEPYLPAGTKTEGNITIADNVEFQIPNDGYVMLGDNRAKSTDSRYWGVVKRESIIGRGLFVYYPTKDFKFLF